VHAPVAAGLWLNLVSSCLGGWISHYFNSEFEMRLVFGIVSIFWKLPGKSRNAESKKLKSDSLYRKTPTNPYFPVKMGRGTY
jgi:hypothetical protein